MFVIPPVFPVIWNFSHELVEKDMEGLFSNNEAEGEAVVASMGMK